MYDYRWKQFFGVQALAIGIATLGLFVGYENLFFPGR